MGHRAGEKQIPVALPPSVIRDLQIAAVRLQEDVPRNRAMNRGPMLGYVARWFLTLPRERQLEVVLAGKAREDGERESVGPDDSVQPTAAGKGDGRGKLVSIRVTKRPDAKRKHEPTKADG